MRNFYLCIFLDYILLVTEGIVLVLLTVKLLYLAFRFCVFIYPY